MTRRYFYEVPAVTVVEDGATVTTADMPAGVSWVGNTDGTTYLVVTDVEVDRPRLFVRDEVPADPWVAGETVTADDRRAYGGIVYRCVQGHTTQAGWEPPNVPALWTPSREDGDPWVQPTGAQDAYPTGAVVLHGGGLWRSQIDANTTEPGTQGHDRWWAPEGDVTDAARDLILGGAPFVESDPSARWSV